MSMYLRLVLLWLPWLLAAVPAARAEEAASQARLALVVGNAQYQSAPLKNPVNDARAMAQALQEVGFEVLLRENLSQQQLIAAMREFGERLKAQGGVALFYYAGHGVQIKGQNYLVPVDAMVDNEDEVRYRAVDANQVLEKMAEAGNTLNLVILDACRDNPFSRSFRSKQAGLAQMDAPSGTLIAFATAPGAVALDGSGVNGVYTKHLLRNLSIPGLPIELVLKRVREGVSKETQQKQIPWESSSLLGEFYFKPAAPGTTALTQADSTAVELAFWESVNNSNVASEYQAYLDKYPRGQFAALARGRLDTLLAQAPGPAARPATEAPTQVALAQPGRTSAARPTDIVRVGDTWTYHLLQGGWFTRKIDTLTVTVTDVQGDNIQERLTLEGFRNFKAERTFRAGFDPTTGFQETELPGHYLLAEFSPYISAAGVPGAGKQWKGIDATLWFGSEALLRTSTKVTVRSVKEERVKIPLGEFTTVRVEALARYEGNKMAGNRALRLVYWYSPQYRRTIKMSRSLVGEGSGGDKESFVLAGVQAGK